MEAALKTYFGFSGFRSYQREIIQKVLEGRDCLVVMATGSGKSICYQIPPLVTKKTAVVVSPLLSLMQDQVWFKYSLQIIIALIFVDCFYKKT
jgi:ATP-dependent DNA helicase RecQ